MKTVVKGASPNPSHYSNIVVKILRKKNIDVIPVGNKKGNIDNLKIINNKPFIDKVHSILLYINPSHQTEYIDYIISLNPKRIIFNPGTYNKKFAEILKSKNIKVTHNCAVDMINNGHYFEQFVY